MPRILCIDPVRPEPDVVAEAASVLARGGLVAFPTETVYGLGARGLHEEDVARVFVAKGRPAGHPLILHVDGEPMARSLSSSWNRTASLLVSELWPGPLTLVVPKAEVVPHAVSGGLETVGLRSPAHPVALALVRAAGEPLAAPSANAHTHVSPTTAEHVVRSLGERVDLVLDSGPCAVGIESTVLALDDPPRVLRPGAISLRQLRAIVPEIVYEPVTLDGDAARAAPGMAAKHYAPRTSVILAPRGADGVSASLASVRSTFGESARIGAIVVTPEAEAAASDCSPLLVLPDSPEGYARELFSALHHVDEVGLDVVVIEHVPSTEPWWAVADRLTRAART